MRENISVKKFRCFCNK